MDILSPGTMVYYIIPEYDEIDTIDFKCFQAKIGSVIWDKFGVKYYLDTKNERYRRELFSHEELFTNIKDVQIELQKRFYERDKYKFQLPEIKGI